MRSDVLLISVLPIDKAEMILPSVDPSPPELSSSPDSTVGNVVLTADSPYFDGE